MFAKLLAPRFNRAFSKKHPVYLLIFFLPQGALCPLFKESLEDVGDLYLDVAEAYINVGKSQCLSIFMISEYCL